MTNETVAGPDFSFCNHGSICTLTPLTDAGREWVAENIGDDAMSWGGGVVIEPRYCADILDGIEAAGLSL